MLYFISDLHLGHENILTFKNDDGTLLRDFKNLAEMHGTIIERWCNVVNANDKVYVLGDIVWGADKLNILKALTGRKILIKGNHDGHFNCRKFLDVFDDIHGVHPITYKGRKFILSHIPIHPESMGRWQLNIHGHLHGDTVGDDRYRNVAVEQIDYTPISIEQIIETTKFAE